MHRFAACALVATAATGIVAAQEIVLSNSSLELRLDAADGSIRQVHNGVRGLDLVTHAGYAPAFVLTVAGGTASATGFAATPVAN